MYSFQVSDKSEKAVLSRVQIIMMMDQSALAGPAKNFKQIVFGIV